MSTPVVVSLLLAWLPAQSAQTGVTFDTLLSAVTAKYGGKALDVTNAELTGTITYTSDQTAIPFTLTFRPHGVRLDLTKTSGTMTFIRNDTRVQTTQEG